MAAARSLVVALLLAGAAWHQVGPQSASASILDGLGGILGSNAKDESKDVKISVKSRHEPHKKNVEEQPHHMIGYNLNIDDSVANNIIAKAAYTLMHPAKATEGHHHTAARQLLGDASATTLAADSQGNSFRKLMSSADKSTSTAMTKAQPTSKAPDFWSTKWREVKVCDDSCDASKNGVCNDGRKANDEEVLCDLGTDCTDCGGWTYALEETEKTPPKPILALREKSVKVFATDTTTYPQFRMPYTDWTHDIDVSGQMHETGTVEKGLTQAMHVAMRYRCVHPNGTTQLFLDIGSNFGWYAFYAAAHGCRVVAWEPVPHFRNFLIYGRQLNHMESLIEIRDRVVTDSPGQSFEMVVPGFGIWGTASIGGLNSGDGSLPGDTKVEVTSERADSLAQENVLIAKIDVEGFEPQAMRSLKGLFDEYRIENVFMEYSPGVYERNEKWKEAYEFPDMLAYMLHSGYKIAHIDDTIKIASLLTGKTWEDGLPPLAEVTKTNVAYDLVDVFKFTFRQPRECWVKALRVLNKNWESCTNRPDDLHPKSFWSSFGYNTNIWATLDHSNFKAKGTASLFQPNVKSEVWYGQETSAVGYGIGMRPCTEIPEGEKVKARCRCSRESDAICAAEMAIVENTTTHGPMTYGQKRLLESAMVYLAEMRDSGL